MRSFYPVADVRRHAVHEVRKPVDDAHKVLSRYLQHLCLLHRHRVGRVRETSQDRDAPEKIQRRDDFEDDLLALMRYLGDLDLPLLDAVKPFRWVALSKDRLFFSEPSRQK